MAKKQTRRSISVSRTTYERLKAFCEANNISMSQLVETRVNDFLGEGSVIIPASNPSPPTGMGPRPTMPSAPRPTSIGSSIGSGSSPAKPETSAPRPSSPVVPMTSAAARFAVDPPPPIIKPKQTDTNAPKPAEKRPDQIFTF
jgi:hypothetical protein